VQTAFLTELSSDIVATEGGLGDGLSSVTLESLKVYLKISNSSFRQLKKDSWMDSHCFYKEYLIPRMGNFPWEAVQLFIPAYSLQPLSWTPARTSGGKVSTGIRKEAL